MMCVFDGLILDSEPGLQSTKDLRFMLVYYNIYSILEVMIFEV